MNDFTGLMLESVGFVKIFLKNSTMIQPLALQKPIIRYRGCSIYRHEEWGLQIVDNVYYKAYWFRTVTGSWKQTIEKSWQRKLVQKMG